MRFRAVTGGFDLKKIEESTPTKVVALVQERNSEQISRVTLEVDSSEPHRITNLDLRAIPRPAEYALPHMGESELITALSTKLDTDSASDRFSGTLERQNCFCSCLRLGRPRAQSPKHSGDTFSNWLHEQDVHGDFDTAASQAGKLGLDDPVGKYLTDYPNKDVAAKVTIRHLLAHTGGTGDIFGPEFDANRLELRTLQD